MSSLHRSGASLLLLSLLAASALAGCSRAERAARASTDAKQAPPAQPAAAASVISTRSYQKPPEATLKQRLSAMEYDVTQNEGTEPPFQNAFGTTTKRACTSTS
jgi:hypothetical protein